jgi:hypothetical protein
MARACATSSVAVAAAAAEALVDDRSSAVDLVIGGFLAAAAARPGVLLGPLGAVVAGVGMGVRSFDGRSCQGGRGVQRPRGFLPEDELPAAASAAVPRSLAALSLLHAYGAKRPMSALARPAVAAAKKGEQPERAALLDAFARGGAQTLLQTDRMRAILREAGSAARGLVSEADLRETRPADEAADFAAANEGLEIALVPFMSTAGPLRRAEVIVAADGRGQVAALAFAPDDEGVAITDLGVTLPRDGEPVRRGVPRVTPGTVLPMALPIAIARRRADGWFAAIGVAGAHALAATSMSGAVALGDGLDAMRAASGGSQAFAASAHRSRTAILVR